MKKHLFLFCLVSLLFSCNESDDSSTGNPPNQEVLILSKIESVVSVNSNETSDIIEFNYDSDNKLINYDYQSLDWPSFSTDLIYSNNQLTELGEYSVSYDENLIILLSTTRKEEYFLENERVVKYKWYLFDTNSSTFNLIVTNEFTFDADFENVIKSEQFDSNGELFIYSDFEYDNNINPFSNFHDVINIHENSFATPLNSKNNPIRRKDYQRVTNFSNESVANYNFSYNDSNYPIHLSYNYGTINLERDFIYLE